MSELLQDDPEPQPSGRQQYYADCEGGVIDEHQAIANLSNRASAILESSNSHGVATDLRAFTKNGELRRTIAEGSWTFSFTDTLEGYRRCRSWRLGNERVSWCSHEKRYEPASDVLTRLEEVFSSNEETEATGTNRLPRVSVRIKRQLARALSQIAR